MHHRGTGGDALALACTCVARAWTVCVGALDSQKHESHHRERRANKPNHIRRLADSCRVMSLVLREPMYHEPTKPTRTSKASPVVMMIPVITHLLVVHCTGSQAPQSAHGRKGSVHNSQARCEPCPATPLRVQCVPKCRQHEIESQT